MPNTYIICFDYCAVMGVVVVRNGGIEEKLGEYFQSKAIGYYSFLKKYLLVYSQPYYLNLNHFPSVGQWVGKWVTCLQIKLNSSNCTELLQWDYKSPTLIIGPYNRF